MPGVDRLAVVEAVKAAMQARDLGIPMLAVFPHIDRKKKDAEGSEALDPGGLIPAVVRAIKDAVPEVGVMCDVALDCFTDHGHDGVLIEAAASTTTPPSSGWSSRRWCRPAPAADVVAPSDMMDGRVGAIRSALGGRAGADVMIMAYAAKYASAFYGPYRERRSARAWR